jgi:hypothetical protein
MGGVFFVATPKGALLSPLTKPKHCWDTLISRWELLTITILSPGIRFRAQAHVVCLCWLLRTFVHKKLAVYVREIPLFSLFLCSGDVIAEKIERRHSCLIFLLLRGNPHGEGNLIYHRQSSLFLERMLQVASTASAACKPDFRILYLDGIHCSVRHGEQADATVILTALGVDVAGNKEVLALRACAEENKDGWVSVLEDLRTRGATQIDLIVPDGHDGLLAAVTHLFPATPRQRCLLRHPAQRPGRCSQAGAS